MATVTGSLDRIRGARFNEWGWGKIAEALGLPRSSGTAVRTAYMRAIAAQKSTDRVESTPRKIPGPHTRPNSPNGTEKI